MAALVLGVLALVMPDVGRAAGAAGFALPTVGGMAVDPASGRVFVSGGDAVRVFGSDATLLATIPSLFGAGGVDLDGGSLWVAETTAGVIAEIDVASLAVVRELPAPVTGASLARLGGGVFYGHGAQLERLDLASGATTAFGPYGGAFERVGTSTTTLLTYDTSSSTRQLVLLDLTTAPATVLATRGLSSLGDVAVAADASVAFLSGAGSIGMVEVSLPTLSDTGRTYPTTDSSVAVATSSALGGIVASSESYGRVIVSKVGQATPILVRETYGDGVPGGIVLAPDGRRAYALTRLPADPVTTYLEVVNVAPVVQAVLPTEVVAGVPAVVSVFGDQVTAATSVTVDGVAAAFIVRAPHIELTMPTAVAPGVRSLVVTTPTGQAVGTLTVDANVGGVLRGVVRGSTSVPVPGVTLTLRGPTLASPRVTTSAFDGSYGFAGLPYGTYSMTSHAPSGASVDERILNIVVVPNDVTPIDVALRERTVGPAGLASWIPSGSGALVVDATTRRVFVRGGGFVDAFDAGGVLLARIVGLPGIGGLAAGGGKVFVDAGRFVRIDPSSLAVTGSWSLGRTSHRDIVHAGGRLWFVYTNEDPYVGVVLASLDPATGAVADAWSHLSAPHVVPIADSADLFYLQNVEGASEEDFVVRAVGAVTAIVSHESSYQYVPRHLAGSGTLDRAWNDLGTEYVLSTLRASGRTLAVPPPEPYLSSPASAATAARGGLVALRDHVFRVDTGAEVATTGLASSPGEVFDPAGDRLYVATGGALVVWDLHPHVTDIGPTLVRPDTTELVLHGDGLGGAYAATLDGQAAPISSATTTVVTLPVQSLAVGSHTVTVTTSLGTSAPRTFDVTARPVVSAVLPPALPTAGGTASVSGAGFTGTTKVTVASVVVPFSVIDDHTITLTVPPHLGLAGPVIVDGPRGPNLDGPELRWVAPTPSVQSLFPPFALAPGSVPVTISGTGFAFATGVDFGGAPALSFTVVDDATIVAVSPAAAAGTVEVRVTTAGGTSSSPVGFTSLASSRFTDVPAGAPFEDDILWAAARRITTGYADGTFRPTGLTDRQAMAAMLYRNAGSPLGAHPVCDQPPFADVPVTNPFCGEIGWLRTKGITTGNPDGTFRPSALVDRQSMAAFLYRAAGRPLGDHPVCGRGPFPDVPATAPFCGEISWLVALEITNGYPDGGFHPTAPIARQATVAFLHRLAQAH